MYETQLVIVPGHYMFVCFSIMKVYLNIINMDTDCYLTIFQIKHASVSRTVDEYNMLYSLLIRTKKSIREKFA